MRTFLARRLLRPTIVAIAACGALAGVGLRPAVRAEHPPSEAERIVAGLEATSAREVHLVGSFTTSRTFTIVHDGQTVARVVAALSFTAPDVKLFTVLESHGSALIRSRVINRMMAAEIEAARAGAHRRVAFTSDNYEFGPVRDDGDAYDNHEVLWQYPKLTMTWMSSLTNSYGFDLHGDPQPARRLGMYFHGANGTMYANYDMFKIVPEGDRMKDLPTPPKSIPSSPGHEREWLDCIKSRRQPSCNPNYHVRVDVPVQLSLLSLKLGRSIRFDSFKEQIVGDREAAKLAIPKYRAPWKFPERYLKA